MVSIIITDNDNINNCIDNDSNNTNNSSNVNDRSNESVNSQGNNTPALLLLSEIAVLTFLIFRPGTQTAPSQREVLLYR